MRLAQETGQQPELWLGHIPYIAAAFALRKCLNCGSEDLDILGYPHDGGIYIPQYRMKFWVFGRCRNCLYENAYTKLEEMRRRGDGVDVDDLAYYLAVSSVLAGQDFVGLLGKEEFRNIVDRVTGLVLENGVRLDTFRDYFRLRDESTADRYIVKLRYRELRERMPDVDERIAARAAEYLRALPKPL
jgi:hypothetical protein